jgi:hypothetical protein
MRHTVLLGVPFLFAAVTMAAQGGSDAGSQGLVLERAASSTACPIGMRARHDFFFQRRLVDGAQPNERGKETGEVPGMQIRLTLTNPDARRITGATVTVRGTNGNWHLVPTRTSPNPGVLTKTMDLTFEQGEDRNADTHLVLSGFTSIGSIALKSVTYADGSTWKTIDRGACRVTPDRVMLIAAQ